MYTTWYQGRWHDGNVPLIGAMDHAVWLASTVFDGARAIHRMVPDLRAHCEREGRDYDEITKTCYYGFDVGEGGKNVGAILADLERFAALGIQEVIGNVTEVWRIQPLEILGSQVINQVADL